MTYKSLLLIINPIAGRMRAGSTLLELVVAFSTGGYEITVYPTEKKGDAEEKVAECGSNYDLVVCYGGDGTLSEVVNGIARLAEKLDNGDIGRIPAFSFIPAGTANDFAATVEMPSVISAAANKIMNGTNRPLDIGAFNRRPLNLGSSGRHLTALNSKGGKFFIYVAAFGLFTSVSYTVDQEFKKVFGQLSYVMEGIKQAIDIPSYKMTIEYEVEGGGIVQKKIIRDEFVVGLVTNTTSVAGMFRLSKSKVKLDDGKFELLLVKNPNNPILLSQIIMDLSAQKYDPEYVIFERVSNITFQCNEPIAWCLDGENGGLHKRATVSNQNKRGIIRL